MSILNMAAYNGSLLVWLGYVAGQESGARCLRVASADRNAGSRASPTFIIRFPRIR